MRNKLLTLFIVGFSIFVVQDTTLNDNLIDDTASVSVQDNNQSAPFDAFTSATTIRENPSLDGVSSASSDTDDHDSDDLFENLFDDWFEDNDDDEEEDD